MFNQKDLFEVIKMHKVKLHFSNTAMGLLLFDTLERTNDALYSGHVCSMQRGSTVDPMGTIWGSTAILHVLL